MVKFIAILTPVVFVTLIAGWASASEPVHQVARSVSSEAKGATDTRYTKSTKTNGSVEVCRYETDFVQTKDGSNMIRTAWVCTTSKVSK